jgi:general secretion pathway protein A
MYERHFGLHSSPFELAADPRFLVALPQYREALSTIQYGLTARKGIVVVTGEAGTGKTTVMRAALDALGGDEGLCVCLTNPALTREEYVEALARAFQLSNAARVSKTALIVELEARLSRLAPNRLRALILDEAQSLPHDLLEEVRLMSNMEADYRKLLPVVLLGQPELGDRLNDPSLRQLKQRVALRCGLRPLVLEETRQFIGGRLAAAGGNIDRLIPHDVVTLIQDRTHGVPRLINVVCDNALVAAFASGKPFVDRLTVETVCAEFDLAAAPRMPMTYAANTIEPVMSRPATPTQTPRASVNPPRDLTEVVRRSGVLGLRS